MRVLFSPSGSMTYLAIGTQPLNHCQIQVPSHEGDFGSNKEVPFYAHNICATIAIVDISCQGNFVAAFKVHSWVRVRIPILSQ